MTDSITCPLCGMTSHNANDVREGYCGNCHDWTSAPLISWPGTPVLTERKPEPPARSRLSARAAQMPWMPLAVTIVILAVLMVVMAW